MNDKRFPNPNTKDLLKYSRMAVNSKSRLKISMAFDWARQHGVWDVAKIAARRIDLMNRGIPQ